MGSIVTLIFILLGLVIAVAVLKVRKDYKKRGDNTENVTIGLVVDGILTGILAIIFVVQMLVIVEAGDVGVQVTFGRVSEGTLSAGFHGKSPFSSVVTYPTRVSEYTMVSSGEGAKGKSDEIDARTSDNSLVSIDATTLYVIDGTHASDIYRSIAKNADVLESSVIRPTLRNAFYDIAARYSLEDIISKRESYGKDVFAYATSALESKHVIVSNILVRSITPPKIIDDAIQTKLASQQMLAQKGYELSIAQKNADIKFAEAQGIKRAQDEIQKTLTPIYVQYEAIQAYSKLAGSPNTTFVIMPTSPNGSGMPIILGAAK